MRQFRDDALYFATRRATLTAPPRHSDETRNDVYAFLWGRFGEKSIVTDVICNLERSCEPQIIYIFLMPPRP